MLNLKRIYKSERLMRAMTGQTVKPFNELMDVFDSAYEKAIDQERRQRGCERKKGAGQKARLASTQLKLFDKETSLRFIPPDRNLWLDKGFQGVQHQHKNVMMPKKKPKNGELTVAEKAQNRVISALRMPIEHVFAGLKRMNCRHHVCRNRKGQDDPFIFLSAGLWNLNLQCR